MNLPGDLNERIEHAVRSIAERSPMGDWFIDELYQDYPIGALRLTLDVASAEGTEIVPSEIALAKEAVHHLNTKDRYQAAIAYSIRNSLKLLAMRELVAA